MLLEAITQQRQEAVLEEVGGKPIPKGKHTQTILVGPAHESVKFLGSDASIPVMQRMQTRMALKKLMAQVQRLIMRLMDSLYCKVSLTPT
jgi:hypothetical protein